MSAIINKKGGINGTSFRKIISLEILGERLVCNAVRGNAVKLKMRKMVGGKREIDQVK